jgi:hypothetical protein
VNWPCGQAKSSVRHEPPSSAAGPGFASCVGRAQCVHGGRYLLRHLARSADGGSGGDAGLDQGVQPRR